MNTRNMLIPSNRVSDIEQYFYSALADLYPPQEIRQFVLILFEAFMGWDTAHFLLNRRETVNQSDLLKFFWAVEDLKKYRPIQHIIGHADFCDCRIFVSGDVLIPRPETEEIVNRTIPLIKDGDRVLDLCTGSGCIAIALASHCPNIAVSAVDVSQETLAVARRNASNNKVSIDFFQADLLDDSSTLPVGCFDLIISNPPYIMRQESSEMERNVLDFEPDLALFVDDNDPLIFYRRIGQYAVGHLNQGGHLVFEINEKLGAETSSLLQSLGFESRLYDDFRGKPRMLVCER